MPPALLHCLSKRLSMGANGRLQSTGFHAINIERLGSRRSRGFTNTSRFVRNRFAAPIDQLQHKYEEFQQRMVRCPGAQVCCNHHCPVVDRLESAAPTRAC